MPIMLTMKKNLLYIIIPLLLLAVVGFFLLKFPLAKRSVQKRNTVYATPPPTLALVKTGPADAHTKLISFPVFHISFRVPNDLKTIKEVDPKSEDTQIGSNFIAFYTPDTVIDPKKHTQTAGAKISFNITSTKKDFTDETEIVPTSSLKDAVTDTSVIPNNNPLLTEKTMQVYSFPADKTVSNKSWVYNAEALIKNGENMLTITFYCIDYTNVTGSPTCQKLLKAILPTFQQSILPSSSKQK